MTWKSRCGIWRMKGLVGQVCVAQTICYVLFLTAFSLRETNAVSNSPLWDAIISSETENETNEMADIELIYRILNLSQVVVVNNGNHEPRKEKLSGNNRSFQSGTTLGIPRKHQVDTTLSCNDDYECIKKGSPSDSYCASWNRTLGQCKCLNPRSQIVVDEMAGTLTCQKIRIPLGERCDMDWECEEYSRASYCNQDKVCECKSNYVRGRFNACYKIAKPGELCQIEDQCEDPFSTCTYSDNLISTCECVHGYRNDNSKCVLSSLWDECGRDEDCTTRFSSCKYKPGESAPRCVCNYGYHKLGNQCVKDSSHNIYPSKSQEIYKVAMIAASCFLVAIIGILLTYIVRRTFCQNRRPANPFRENGGDNDVYSIESDPRFAGADKPPSYLDVVREVEAQYGVPPPAYENLPSTSTNFRTQQDRFNGPFFLPDGPSTSAAHTTTASASGRTLQQRPITNVVVTDDGELERTTIMVPSTPINASPVAERQALIRPQVPTAPTLRGEENPEVTSLPRAINALDARDHRENAYGNLAFVQDE